MSKARSKGLLLLIVLLVGGNRLALLASGRNRKGQEDSR